MTPRPGHHADQSERIAAMRTELADLAHTTATARRRRRVLTTAGLALIALASAAAAVLTAAPAATQQRNATPHASTHTTPIAAATTPTPAHAPSRIEILTARPASSIIVLDTSAPTTIEYIDDPTLITLADAAGSPLGTARIDNRLSVVYRTREQ